MLNILITVSVFDITAYWWTQPDGTRSAIHPALGRCSTSRGGDRVAEGFRSGVDSRAMNHSIIP